MKIELPSKPKFGSACNGCGFCCASEICAIGVMAFPGAQAPCPALKIRPDGKSTYCEIVETERINKMEPLIETALGIGKGCDSSDDESSAVLGEGEPNGKA